MSYGPKTPPRLKGWVQLKHILSVLFATAVLLVALRTAAQNSGGNSQQDGSQSAITPDKALSLYERIGGDAVIESLVSDIYDQHASDPLSEPWFGPGKVHGGIANNGDPDYVKRHVVNFFGSGIGGSQVYDGKDMLTAHRGMTISNVGFLAVEYHVLSNLHKYGVDTGAIGEVLAILESLRVDVQSNAPEPAGPTIRGDTRSLYERIGGQDKIYRLVSDVYDQHASDPLSGPWFDPSSNISQDYVTGNADYVKRHVVNFFGSGIGGPQVYDGKDMITAHIGMEISNVAFLAVEYHVLSNMERHAAGGPGEREEVLAILESLKPDIVQRGCDQDGQAVSGA